MADDQALLRSYRDLPHEKQMRRAEMVERYVREEVPITQAVVRVAKEENVQPRTIYRARDYAGAFLNLSEDIREALATYVNDKRVKVEYVHKCFAILDETQQREALARWATGEFPEPIRSPSADQSVMAEAPAEESDDIEVSPQVGREHSRIQALLAQCGEAMGFQIWVPNRDRKAVLAQWNPKPGTILDSLPLSFNENALRTISEIDVLWVKKNAIRRAFEVEHSTAIYSGLLRMSDLLAQLPTTVFNLHIVAPPERKDRVLREIDRPTFKVLDPPLRECCTFLSYDSVERIFNSEHLSYLPDSVLEEYVDWVESDE